MNHSNMAGLTGGGPPGVPMMNNGVNGATPRIENEQELDYETRLNTWIYDHFVRKEYFGCARAMANSPMNIRFRKPSQGRRAEVNGMDEGIMETDMKDEVDSKRPDDIPQADVGSDKAETSILMEWFCLYWDLWMAQRKNQRATPQAAQYVHHTQASYHPCQTNAAGRRNANTYNVATSKATPGTADTAIETNASTNDACSHE